MEEEPLRRAPLCTWTRLPAHCTSNPWWPDCLDSPQAGPWQSSIRRHSARARPLQISRWLTWQWQLLSQGWAWQWVARPASQGDAKMAAWLVGREARWCSIFCDFAPPRSPTKNCLTTPLVKNSLNYLIRSTGAVYRSVLQQMFTVHEKYEKEENTQDTVIVNFHPQTKTGCQKTSCSSHIHSFPLGLMMTD